MKAEPDPLSSGVEVRGTGAAELQAALTARGSARPRTASDSLVIVCLEEGARLGPQVVAEEASRTVGLQWESLRAPGVAEVVCTYRTRLASVARARSLVRGLGLVPVRRADRGVSLRQRLREVENGDAVDRALAAAQLVDSGISSAADVETTALRGLGWKQSPFAPLRDVAGIEEITAEIHRRGRRLPFSLRRLQRSATAFGAPELEVHSSGDTHWITLQRPITLNALDPAYLSQLEEAVDDALQNDDCARLRLRATGRAFLAGVDSAWILSRMEEDDLESILDLVRRGQSLLRRLADSPSVFEIEVDGLAAGAGVEFCAAADRVITTAQARFLMPETSLGITPALGGTQRLPRRLGLPLARWMVLTGDAVSAGRARAMGLSDEAPFTDMRGLGALAALFDPAHSLEELLSGDAEFENWVKTSLVVDEEGERWVRRAHHQLRQRAPLALRHTDRLLRLSADLDLDAGLAAEVEVLPEIFRSQDALCGVRAAAEGRRARRFGAD